MKRTRWVGVRGWAAAVGLAVLCAPTGCSKKAEEEASAPASKPGAKRQGGEDSVQSGERGSTSAATAAPTAAATSKATELDSVALPSAADCVRQCVDRNQMRAASADTILADCKQACRKECVERCDELAETRSGRFGDACREDCGRQVGDGD